MATVGKSVAWPAERSLGRAIWRHRDAYLFIAAPLISLALFLAYPFCSALFLSFTDWNGIEAPNWIGLDNYTHLIQDPEFVQSVQNTFVFAIESLAGGVVLALCAALALNQKLRRRDFFRTVYFLPVVTNLVAIGFLWKLIYHPEGLLNYLLSLVRIPPIHWLGDSNTALHAIVIMSIWQGFGYSMVLFLSALQTIPAELYDAAKIDGAGAWMRLVHVTLPGLRNIFVFVSITGVAGAFTVFTQIYVMTQGGPLGSTQSLMMYLLKQFNALNLGYANAIGFVLFFFLFIFALLNLKIAGNRS